MARVLRRQLQSMRFRFFKAELLLRRCLDCPLVRWCPRLTSGVCGFIRTWTGKAATGQAACCGQQAAGGKRRAVAPQPALPSGAGRSWVERSSSRAWSTVLHCSTCGSSCCPLPPLAAAVETSAPRVPSPTLHFHYLTLLLHERSGLARSQPLLLSGPRR